MIVAIDAEAVEEDKGTRGQGDKEKAKDEGGRMKAEGGKHRLAADATGPSALSYARYLLSTLTLPESPVEKVVVLADPENRREFELFRDSRCLVVTVPRPLFQGHAVSDWASLLLRHPRAGADLLAAHQQEKLRIMGQTGASVIHFPCDARDLMEMDCAVVVSIHSVAGSVPLSVLMADAIVLDDETQAQELARDRIISADRVFIAPWGQAVSTPQSSKADNELWAQRTCLAALVEAYEHALASFELRKAA